MITSARTRISTEHTALKAASRIVRDRGSNLDTSDAAHLARMTKLAAPVCSAAACRRAVDVVIAKRLQRPEFLGITKTILGTRRIPSRAKGRTLNPVPSLADRLRAFKRGQLAGALDSCGFRHSRAWDDAGTLAIEFGSPAATQTTTEGWIDYKSHGYRKGIVGETVTIAVPADWGTRIRRTGLAILDGLFTLDAEQLPTYGPVEVYRAAWARQGRGVSLVTERGYIARHAPSGTTYHSTDADPEKALRGLKRKLAAQAIPAEVRDARQAERTATRRDRQSRQLAKLIDRVSRYDLADIAHVEVTRQDSLRAGNCVPGTDAFIDKFGFDGRDSATVGEIAAAVGLRGVAGLTGVDLTLARQLAAAVLVAVRRDKQARRLVLA